MRLPVIIKRLPIGRFCAAAVFALGAPLCAQEGENTASLDLYIFNQNDNGGGNPFINEEFFYYGGRIDAKLKVSKVVSLRPVFFGSQIQPGSEITPPASIINRDVVTNATTTSASATNLGGSFVADIRPANWDWTLSPGAYFSYQPTYVSRGLDFTLQGDLFGGDFSPWFAYGFRFDAVTGGNLAISGIFNYGLPSERDSDGRDNRLHSRLSHNFVAGFTQTLSPQWRVNASLQYTLQTGYLSTPNAKVALYTGNTPVLFADEKLPIVRNRFQINFRARYSPLLHWSVGADHSAYFDDWGIMNLAFQPAAEGPFVADVAHWRAWYRLGYQQGTRYQRDKPQQEHRYQTDDSDLGTFSSNGGGVLLFFYLPRDDGMRWAIRVSGYMFARNDGIWGAGAMLGTGVDW